MVAVFICILSMIVIGLIVAGNHSRSISDLEDNVEHLNSRVREISNKASLSDDEDVGILDDRLYDLEGQIKGIEESVEKAHIRLDQLKPRPLAIVKSKRTKIRGK